MGILEKFGLIEDNKATLPTGAFNPIKAPIPTISFVAENPADLLKIEDIYAKASLEDTSKSILKVGELKAALPSALAADIAKQTLAGIMVASGLDKDSVALDAQARIGALDAAAEAVAKDTLEKVTAAEAEIAEYEAKINAAKELINAAKKTQEEQEAAITAEITKIKGITAFLS